MFFIPTTIPEFAAGTFFPVTVRTPGGAAINFSQSLNFELKFFFWTFLNWKKIAQGVVESIFCPEMSQNVQKIKKRFLRVFCKKLENKQNS